MEVALAVLAATSTTSIVFFPVSFFYGVSKYLFTDLALGVVLSIFASYIFAMTVVPLYCAQFIRLNAHGEAKRPRETDRAAGKSGARVQRDIPATAGFLREACDASAAKAWPHGVCIILGRHRAADRGFFPFVGRAYFPRTDPGQFVINVKAPTGTRLEVTDKYIARVEEDIRSVIPERRIAHDRFQHRDYA